MKYYSGVGSRKTPLDVRLLMAKVAKKLSATHVLRSGGAIGADRAFEQGAGRNKKIYMANDATEEAKAIAAKFHPVWYKLSDFVKKLHGRNAFQVLGDDLATPSKFLICWTPDGCVNHESRTIRTGGTGTAISIASENDVLVFNLAIIAHRERLEKWLDKE
jgi:hypothetical protein